MSRPGPRDERGHYTHGHEPATLASHGARTAANSAAYLLGKLEPGMSLLDVGCGPATITLDLAERVAPGVVTAIEYVETPLLAARAAAAARGDTSTVFEVANAEALPYPDDSFDVVHAHQVLQHLTDPVQALREMWRVCRPGGWVAARDADYAAMSWFPTMPELELWRRTYRAAARANGAEPDAGRRLRQWARSAGISNPQLGSSTWTFADPDACAWWGHGQADRFGGEVFAQQARDLGSTAAEVGAIADGWRRWAADPNAWFVIVHGELLAQKPV